MSSPENKGNEYFEQWTDYGLRQLYQYMGSEQPSLENDRIKDPLALAKMHQTTLDEIPLDPNVKNDMAKYSEETLNEVARKKYKTHHLVIFTKRLIVLTQLDFEEWEVQDHSTDSNGQGIMIQGLFGRFAYEPAADHQYLEQDSLTIRMDNPDFLYTTSKIIRDKISPSNKNLIYLEEGSQLTIPVASVEGQAYDAESLFGTN